MKCKVNYKESEWPAFNQEIMQLAKQQREEVVRTLSGQGQYRLLPQYSHFSVPATTWVKMKPQQRFNVVDQFDKATLKSRCSLSSQPSSHFPASSQAPGTSFALEDTQLDPAQKQLSITAEESSITKLTLTTIQSMWEKAEELLSTQNAITPAPGSDSTARMVISYSSSMPHLVLRGSNGQYRCDDKCIAWTSLVYAHILLQSLR